MKEYSIPRSKVVILSKCFFGVDEGNVGRPINQSSVNDGDMVNCQGLSRKHILDAVDASVARLGTYIDVLQIHRLDRDTPREEIMKALNDVVESGKVRYIGASSMAAWEFQTLQNIADRKGWHKFISMQNYYNLIYREEEREMVSCNPFPCRLKVSLLMRVDRYPTVKIQVSVSSPGHQLLVARSLVPGTSAPPSAQGPTSSLRTSYTRAKTRLTKRSSSE